jgi:hypothetical protein
MMKLLLKSFLLCGTFGKQEMIIGFTEKLGVFCRYFTQYQRIYIPTDWLGENLHLLPWRTDSL